MRYKAFVTQSYSTVSFLRKMICYLFQGTVASLQRLYSDSTKALQQCFNTVVATLQRFCNGNLVLQ